MLAWTPLVLGQMLGVLAVLRFVAMVRRGRPRWVTPVFWVGGPLCIGGLVLWERLADQPEAYATPEITTLGVAASLLGGVLWMAAMTLGLMGGLRRRVARWNPPPPSWGPSKQRHRRGSRRSRKGATA